MSKDLVSRLSQEEAAIRRHSLRCISPDDAKYGKDSEKLADYLSPEAEWRGCAYVQKVLLETRYMRRKLSIFETKIKL